MTLPTSPSLRVGAKSHVGKVRTENQDRMSRFTSPLGEVFIVADGMGGHQGGQTAVAMTVDGFDAHLRVVNPESSVSEALQSAAQSTNEELYKLANSDDPTVAKMGSTVVLTVIDSDRMWIGHAGDSRAYLYREGHLSRLTRDHSMVQRMIDHEMLTEEQARNHPDASVIDRAFGQQPHLELEVSGPLELLPGDGILLCTDGLSGYVGDEKIAAVVDRYSDAQEVTAALIDLALNAGGEDNVTVQYVLFNPTNEQADGAIETTTPKRPAARKSQRASFKRPSRLLLIALPLGGVLLGVLLTVSVLLGVPKVLTQFRQETPPLVESPSPLPSQATPSPSPETPETPKPTEGQEGIFTAAPSTEPLAPVSATGDEPANNRTARPAARQRNPAGSRPRASRPKQPGVKP